MSDGKSNPPRPAIWFLQHACPGDNEALTGDLIEEFHKRARFDEGQTRGWFWRQVLIACFVGVAGEMRRHWPAFCYAIAGWILPVSFAWTAFMRTAVLHWYRLWIGVAWWAPIVDFPEVLFALSALPVLAVALGINRAFRWSSLFRAGAINLALLTFAHNVPLMFPSLTRLVEVNPRLYHQDLIIPVVFQMLAYFFAFLVPAWFGCAAPRHNR